MNSTTWTSFLNLENSVYSQIEMEQTKVLKKFVDECVGVLFVAGNGGSGANASHFCEDFFKNKGKQTSCLGIDPQFVTMIANDYSFSDIYKKDLERQARRVLRDDRLLVMTTSGRSQNILYALEWAQQKGMASFAMVGSETAKVKKYTQGILSVNSSHPGTVENAHMLLLHWLVYA